MLLKHRYSGHNLLEVMIASMIFSTTVILFLGVWQSFYRSQTLARNRLAAIAYAQAVLEEKIAGGFDALLPGETTVPPIASQSELRTRPLQCELVAQLRIIPNSEVFKKVVVKVSWKDFTGSKSVTYQTHVYKGRQ